MDLSKLCAPMREDCEEMLGRFLGIRAAAEVCNGDCDGNPCVWRLAQEGTEIARAALNLVEVLEANTTASVLAGGSNADN